MYLFKQIDEVKDVRKSLKRHSQKNYPNRSINDITDIAIHHSLTKSGSAESYANYHVENNGWPGIAYMFVIEKDGTIKWCIDFEEIGYHVGNSNSFALGICLTGDFRYQEPTKEQKNSLRLLHKCLVEDLPNYKRTRGHNEFPGYSWKACPEFDYNEVLNGGMLPMFEEWQYDLLAKIYKEYHESVRLKDGKPLLSSKEWYEKAQSKQITVEEIAFLNTVTEYRKSVVGVQEQVEKGEFNGR